MFHSYELPTRKSGREKRFGGTPAKMGNNMKVGHNNNNNDNNNNNNIY
jgi:hypothetical protein